RRVRQLAVQLGEMFIGETGGCEEWSELSGADHEEAREGRAAPPDWQLADGLDGLEPSSVEERRELPAECRACCYGFEGRDHRRHTPGRSDPVAEHPGDGPAAGAEFEAAPPGLDPDGVEGPGRDRVETLLQKFEAPPLLRSQNVGTRAAVLAHGSRP